MHLKSKIKYWYKFYYIDCHGCGRSSKLKEREYSEKPDDPSKRHIYKQQWCGCFQ